MPTVEVELLLQPPMETFSQLLSQLGQVQALQLLEPQMPLHRPEHHRPLLQLTHTTQEPLLVMSLQSQLELAQDQELLQLQVQTVLQVQEQEPQTVKDQEALPMLSQNQSHYQDQDQADRTLMVRDQETHMPMVLKNLPDTEQDHRHLSVRELTAQLVQLQLPALHLKQAVPLPMEQEQVQVLQSAQLLDRLLLAVLAQSLLDQSVLELSVQEPLKQVLLPLQVIALPHQTEQLM
jgi:hypothetical protein